MPPPNRSLAIFALAFSACAAGSAVSEAKTPGVTGDAVTFGQSSCFSGFCRGSGLQYRAGILAAFHERNRQGGVKGRKLELRSMDDGYDPDAAAANAKKLAASDEVFAVIGGLGTPTAKRAAPILREAMVPFVGVLTGADFLRDADRFPNVVNLRTGYNEETRKLVNHMFAELGARRFGIIYQDDAFGRSVLTGYKAALADLKLPVLAKASYTRHTHAVQGSVFVMAKADLDAVMLAMNTDVAAAAINTARSLGHRYLLGLLSIVDIERLKALVDYRIDPILLTRVTPDLEDRSVKLVVRFRSVLADYKSSEPEAAERVVDPKSLEGYILGRFVADVLERMPGEPNRTEFLSTALTSGPVVIDDWTIAFGAGGNAGSSYVRLIDSVGGVPKKEAAR